LQFTSLQKYNTKNFIFLIIFNFKKLKEKLNYIFVGKYQFGPYFENFDAIMSFSLVLN